MDKEKEKKIIKELCESVSDLSFYNFNKHYVIEGEFIDPNDMTTIRSGKKIHGPYTEERAKEIQMELIRKNVDNYYHNAYIITKEE